MQTYFAQTTTRRCTRIKETGSELVIWRGLGKGRNLRSIATPEEGKADTFSFGWSPDGGRLSPLLCSALLAGRPLAAGGEEEEEKREWNREELTVRRKGDIGRGAFSSFASLSAFHVSACFCWFNISKDILFQDKN